MAKSKQQPLIVIFNDDHGELLGVYGPFPSKAAARAFVIEFLKGMFAQEKPGPEDEPVTESDVVEWYSDTDGAGFDGQCTVSIASLMPPITKPVQT